MGYIFSIQSFCVDDGPGIRTCVYLKGCNMRCAWCHNPESLSLQPEVSYIARNCIGCGRCAQICAGHRFENGAHIFDRASCNCGGRAAEACPTGALSRIGEAREAAEIIAETARDKRYFKRSGGGLTLTGGEPMLQYDFVCELVRLAKEQGINVCIETNGTGRTEDYLALIPDVQAFLMDYKLTDDAKHRQYTGISNRNIIENIRRVAEAGGRVVLRCPIILGVNDTKDHFAAIAELTRSLPLLGFEIMPYHSFGVSKNERLGREGQVFAVPEKETVEAWRQEILSLGGREWRREV